MKFIKFILFFVLLLVVVLLLAFNAEQTGASSYFRKFNLVKQATTVASSASAVNILATGNQVFIITGGTPQTFNMPDATELEDGRGYQFFNKSTAIVTVLDDNGGTLASIAADESADVFIYDNGSNSGEWDSEVHTDESIISHSAITNLGADDHTIYQTDARAAVRHFLKSEHIDKFSGLVGEPVKTGADGLLDPGLFASTLGQSNTASNQGTGTEVFIQKTGTDLEFRGIATGNGVSIVQGTVDLLLDLDINGLVEDALIASGDFIPYFDTVAGEAKKVDYNDFVTLSNQGTGTLVFIQKTDRDFELRGIATGNGVSVFQGPVDLLLDLDVNGLVEDSLIASGDFLPYFDTVDGEEKKIDYNDLITLSNQGTGTSVFIQKTDRDFELRGIATGSGVSIVQGSVDLLLDLDINGLTEEAAIATGDFIAIFEAGSGESRKVDFDTLQAEIASSITAGGSAAGQGNCDTLVGSAADVSASDADESSLVTAIANATVGQMLCILDSHATTESILLTKQLAIVGAGRGSEIDGTFTFATSSNFSVLERVRVTGKITIASTTSGVIVDKIWSPNVGLSAIEDVSTGSHVTVVIEE